MYRSILYVISAIMLLGFLGAVAPFIPYISGWVPPMSGSAPSNLIFALWAMSATRGIGSARWTLVLLSALFTLFSIAMILAAFAMGAVAAWPSLVVTVLLAVLSIVGAVSAYSSDTVPA